MEVEIRFYEWTYINLCCFSYIFTCLYTTFTDFWLAVNQ